MPERLVKRYPFLLFGYKKVILRPGLYTLSFIQAWQTQSAQTSNTCTYASLETGVRDAPMYMYVYIQTYIHIKS